MIETHPSILEVAAGVIVNSASRVLIAQRPDHQHMGGLWEFPGGKVEPGETPHQALARELKEELGVVVKHASPLIAIRHDYPDRKVRLHVWRVEAYTGTPTGLQGQAIRWVEREDLGQFAFPAANRPIVTAARLPDRYAILDPSSDRPEDFRKRLAEYADSGITLLRLRASRLTPGRYAAFAREAAEYCQSRGMALLLNGLPELMRQIGAAGLHLRSDELMALSGRPVDRQHWLAVSCHDPIQLRQAARIGADFAVLGPVYATLTHPDVKPLGWEAFAAMVEEAAMPVFALGGLGDADLEEARGRGAQGVAAIRGFASGRAS